MKLHRFYVTDQLGETLEVTDERLVHQWRNVLRLDNGATLQLFNGKEEAVYCFDDISKKRARLSKQSAIPNIPALPERWLLFAPLRREHTELVVQKATELGVSNIVPIISKRSTTKESNTERLQKIAAEANEQSGRQSIPLIYEAISLEQAIALAQEASVELYIADERLEGASEASATKKGIIIGPEGGWDPSELQRLTSMCKPLNLGPLTLRAETAAIVGLFSISR